MNPSLPPPFWQLGGLPFQELCRDLLRAEPEVASCEVYGEPGQRQYGVDLEARLADGRCRVGQCKAQETFKARHLQNAAEEFWKFLAYWMDRKVERFIVLVGCGVADTAVLEEARKQRDRFKNAGVAFELWDSREISTRLCPHRPIVERRCFDYVNLICGVPLGGGVRLAEAHAPAPTLSGDLLEELGQWRDRRIDELREDMRAGRGTSAEAQLSQMRGASSWPVMPSATRARALRLWASLILNRRGDFAHARDLLAEARELNPGAPPAPAEALLAFHTEGVAAALQTLGTHPADADAWNLRLAVLLHAGEEAEVSRVLSAPGFVPNAETWRLRAVVALGRHDVAEARAAVSQALDLGGNWQSVQEIAAVTEYLAALSPAAPTWRQLDWPLPPDQNLVKRDAASVAALRKAEESFAKILANTELPELERRRLETWRLACLANDRTRREEAAEWAGKCLARYPGHTRIIIWSLERGYNIPLGPAREALERRCRAPLSDPQPVQTLFALLVHTKDYHSAGVLLDEHRSLYERVGAMSLWRFERAQAWLTAGDEARARQLLTEETDPEQRIKSQEALIRMQALRGGGPQRWTALAKVRAERFVATGRGDDLFGACEAYHFAGKPTFVADHALELVRRVGTEPALCLALDGAFANGRTKLCLDLLNQHRDLFPNGVLPLAVRRLWIESLRREGHVMEAKREAQALADEGDTPRDLLYAFELQRAGGDLERAALTARRLVENPLATPDALLHLSSHLHADAPEIARQAWRQVVERGVTNPHLAAAATQTGFALGMDDLLGPLLGQVQASLGQPGTTVKAMSLTELLEWQHQEHVEREKAADAYARGHLATHLYAQATGVSLAGIIRGSLQMNEAAGRPLGSFGLRLRHGSREAPVRWTGPGKPDLFLDVSSILLGHHLELLDLLEGEFTPIRVSPHLTGCIQHQIESLAREQSSLQPPRAEVLELTADGHISLLDVKDEAEEGVAPAGFSERMGPRWMALHAYASTHGGYLVDHLPLQANDGNPESVNVPEEITGILRGQGDILAGLQAAGLLTAAQHQLASERLGAEAWEGGGNVVLHPEPKVVVLENGIAASLAHSGVLRVLCAHARVSVARSEREVLRWEEQSRRTRMEHVTWLRSLRERLRRGLEDGRYVPLPSSKQPSEGPRYANTPEGRCLWDLLDDGRPGSFWTCCDDRLISRVQRYGRGRVVGTFDLLHELHRRGRLSAEGLYERLHRLRAGNARYLPVSSAEILHHLRQAALGPDGLVETVELATLRRYVAACLLDGQNLQRPPPDHPGCRELTEARFVGAFQTEINEALLGLWRDDELPLEWKQAASDWVLHQLWFDLAGAVATINGPNGTAPPVLRKMVGASEAMLIFRALALPAVKGDRKAQTERSSYFVRWLLTRMEPDADRLQSIGRHLRASFRSTLPRATTKKDRVAMARLHGELFLRLPEELRRATGLSKKDLAAMRLDAWTPMRVGDWSFDLNEFLRVAERAIRTGKPVTARARGFQDKPQLLECTVTAIREDQCWTLDVRGLDGSAPYRMTDQLTGLLDPDLSQREAVLAKARPWLDLSGTEAMEVLPKLAALGNFQERIRQFLLRRENSLTVQLGELTAGLGTIDGIPLKSLLPRSVEATLRHLRLSPDLVGGPLNGPLEAASRTLVADEGFEQAFLRVGILPVALPAAIIEGFNAWEPSSRDAWVKQAVEQTQSPMLRVQLARLLFQCAEDWAEQGVNVLTTLAAPAFQANFAAFEALLTWTFHQLALEAPTGTSEGALLAAAWIHAGRIHQLLAVRIKHDEFASFLRPHAKSRPPELFRDWQRLSNDAAGPGSFRACVLIAHGSAYAVGARELAGELHDQLAAVLRPVCFPFAEHPTQVNLELLRPRGVHPDRLGSLLARSEQGVFSRLLGEDDATRFSEEHLTAELTGVLGELGQQPTSHLWCIASILLGGWPPPAPAREAVRNLLLSTTWKDLWQTAEHQEQTAVMFLANQAANFADDAEVWARTCDQFLIFAGEHGARQPDSASVANAAPLLINAAHAIACGQPGEERRAREFARLVSELCQRWPAGTDEVWRLLSPFLLRQPSTSALVLWEIVAKLRATSTRIVAPTGSDPDDED